MESDAVLYFLREERLHLRNSFNNWPLMESKENFWTRSHQSVNDVEHVGLVNDVDLPEPI